MGDEGIDFGGVFDAGGGFDAAGDIDSVGAGEGDGFGDVSGGEAAGEDDREVQERRTSGAERGPVDGLAGAAIAAGSEGVEEEGLGEHAELPALFQVARVLGEVGSLAAEGADDRDFGDVAEDLEELAGAAESVLEKIAEQLGGLVTVQLDAETGFGAIEVGFADRPEDFVERGVHKDTKDLDLVGGVAVAQALDDLGGLVGDHVPRALVVEIEADGVGAGFSGEEGVVGAGDAADFDDVHAGEL